MPALPQQPEDVPQNADPAGFLLLVLGLVAVLLGMRNLRELRSNRMAPRRPWRKPKHSPKPAPSPPERKD